MYKKKVKISYKPGLHARPATIIAQKANDYDSDIILKSESAQANLKSLLGVLSLGVGYGEEVIVRAEGDDEKEAVERIVKFINSEMEEAVEKKFNNKSNAKKEINKKINDEIGSENEYNVESEKLLQLIGKEVKDKIKYIRELVSSK